MGESIPKEAMKHLKENEVNSLIKNRILMVEEKAPIVEDFQVEEKAPIVEDSKSKKKK